MTVKSDRNALFLLALIFSLAVVLCGAEEVRASDPVSLGQDRDGMTWYIIDYGRSSYGVPFALARKYYTNETIKNETIALLISRYGISSSKASNLYFTEYEYEYSSNGTQFAVTFIGHYDLLGNEIFSSVYDDSADSVKKEWISLSSVPNSTPAIAARYVFPSSGGGSGGGGCNSGLFALAAILAGLALIRKQ